MSLPARRLQRLSARAERNRAPTFAFIDPFGYSGLPVDVLADLLAYPRAEVFVNFMVGHVQRFVRRDGQEAAMRSLFGIDVHEILNGYDGQADRVRYLRAVYDRQLRDRVGFGYVQSFGMINNSGNIGYLEVLFRCRATSGTARVNDSESVEVSWHALDQLPDLSARTLRRIAQAMAGTDRAAYAFSGAEKVLGPVL